MKLKVLAISYVVSSFVCVAFAEESNSVSKARDAVEVSNSNSNIIMDNNEVMRRDRRWDRGRVDRDSRDRHRGNRWGRDLHGNWGYRGEDREHRRPRHDFRNYIRNYFPDFLFYPSPFPYAYPRPDNSLFGRIECVAEDYAGRHYSAVGFNHDEVQELALQECYRQSSYCRPLGCGN